MGRAPTIYPGPVVDQAIADLVASGDVLVPSMIDQPNGVVGIDASGNVLANFAIQKDTEANLKTDFRNNGVLRWATDSASLFLDDGSTLGGNFVRSGFQFAGNGINGIPNNVSTDLPSTTNVTLAAVTLPAHSSWRASGLVSFYGDTDLQSNFRLIFNKSATGWAPWLDPNATPGAFYKTFSGYCGWSFNQSNPTMDVSTATMQVINGVSQTTNVTVLPTDLTKQQGVCFFDVIFGSYLQGAFNLQASLRQAKGGTNPSISAAFAMTLERLK